MTTILLIEDEEMLREEVVDWLLLEAYATLSAADGAEGVRLARQHQPDLIICDMTLPTLNGYEVLQALRDDPQTAGIPFIFVSARAAYEDVEQGIALGAKAYVTKPFTLRDLLDAIEKHVAK